MLYSPGFFLCLPGFGEGNANFMNDLGSVTSFSSYRKECIKSVFNIQGYEEIMEVKQIFCFSVTDLVEYSLLKKCCINYAHHTRKPSL